MRDLLLHVGPVFFLKVAATALAFMLNIILARTLGVDDVGLYFLVLSVITILATVSRLGLDNVVTRFIASEVSKQNLEAVKGIYEKSFITVFVVSSLIGFFLFLAAPWFSIRIFSNEDLVEPFRLISFCIVPISLFVLLGHALQGMERVKESVLVSSFLHPFVTIVFVALLVPIWGLEGALLACLSGAIATALIGLGIWKKNTCELNDVKSVFPLCELFKPAVPLFWVAILNIMVVKSSVLLLGAIGSVADVAVFNVAERTAALLSFIMFSINAYVAPRFAAMYAKGERSMLQDLARKSTYLATLLASPILLAFLVFPEAILLLFGEEFSIGWPVLIILAVGYFFNVITGSVGYLCIMCGYERLFRNAVFVSAAINVILNLVLIPEFGVIGAAISMATAIVVQNLIAVCIVWKKLKILTLPIPVR